MFLTPNTYVTSGWTAGWTAWLDGLGGRPGWTTCVDGLGGRPGWTAWVDSLGVENGGILAVGGPHAHVKVEGIAGGQVGGSNVHAACTVWLLGFVITTLSL